MASVYHLFANANTIAYQIIKENSNLEAPTRVKHFAALKIQRCYRGYLVRREIFDWNKHATLIQKHVRGWLVRWHLPEHYAAYLERLRMWRYHEMATRIQSFWKGYKVRKSMDMSTKDMVEHKKGVAAASEQRQMEIRTAFQALRENPAGLSLKTPEEKEKIAEECRQWVLYILFKTHHLVRTTAREGIYSIHGQSELSKVERWLKSLPMQSCMDEIRRIYNYRVRHDKKKITYRFKDRFLQKLEDLYRDRDKTQDLKEIPVDDRNIHDSRFDLYKQIKREPYKRNILYQDPYTDIKEPEFRRPCKSHLDFEIHTKKYVPVQPKEPTYHIDFWSQKKCPLHYVNSL